MASLSQEKYRALRMAEAHARAGFYKPMLAELKRAREISFDIGIPLAISIEERIEGIYSRSRPPIYELPTISDPCYP